MGGVDITGKGFCGGGFEEISPPQCCTDDCFGKVGCFLPSESFGEEIDVVDEIAVGRGGCLGGT